MHLYTISAGERIVVFKLIINSCVFLSCARELVFYNSFTPVYIYYQTLFIKNSISMTFTSKADLFNRQVGNHN